MFFKNESGRDCLICLKSTTKGLLTFFFLKQTTFNKVTQKLITAKLVPYFLITVLCVCV